MRAHVSDPGAVAVWPPVRRPNIHGVTFDDVRVELRVSGVAAPTRSRAQGSIIEEQAVITRFTLSPSRGPPRRRSPPRRLLVRPGVEPRRRTSLDLTPITHTSEHDARRRRLPARPFARSPRDCRCLSTPPTQINFLRSPERGRIPTGTVSRVRPGSPRCLFLRVLRHFPPASRNT